VESATRSISLEVIIDQDDEIIKSIPHLFHIWQTDKYSRLLGVGISNFEKRNNSVYGTKKLRKTKIIITVDNLQKYLAMKKSIKENNEDFSPLFTLF
jgi:hypothetical protein